MGIKSVEVCIYFDRIVTMQTYLNSSKQIGYALDNVYRRLEKEKRITKTFNYVV